MREGPKLGAPICDHCRLRVAAHTWDLRACAAGGEVHRAELCTPCDLELNALALRYVRAPNAEARLADYAAERGLPVPATPYPALVE